MSKEHLRDLRFVLAEHLRLQIAFAEGIRPTREDVFCMIPHPSGRGSTFIGKLGFEALDRLAKAAATGAGIAKRVNLVDLRRALGELISERFLRDGVEPSDSTVARLLKDVARRLQTKLRKRAFLIPCHLSTWTEQVPIILGPVRFVGTPIAQRRLRKAFFRLRSETSDFELDRSWLIQAIRFYRGFRWFAEVGVEGCDDQRATEIARESATAALNFLQLIVGARHSHKMQIEGVSSHGSRSATLHFTGDDQLNFSTTVGYMGEVGFPEGWSAELAQGELGLLCQQAGLVLETVVNPDLERPLSQRMLDSVQWFGEAVRDPSPSTRIIKYVTGLERLVLTGRFKDISEAVSDRVAALCVGLEPLKEFGDLKAEFKRVYDVRSSLVHGSLSPSSPKVKANLGAASRFAENAMRRALANWTGNGFRQTGKDQVPLHSWFENLIAAVRGNPEADFNRAEVA